MQSRGCCERGSGVQYVPCRGEGREQTRGEIVWQLSRSHPRYGLLGTLVEPATPPPGEAFLGTPRPTQIGAPQASPVSRPLGSSGAAWVPRAAPETSPSLEPAPRGSPASHAACVAVCVCVCMRVWVGASSVSVWKRWAAVSVPALCLKASRSVVSGVHRTRWQSRGGEYEPLVVTPLSAVSELPGRPVWSVIFIFI